MLSFFLPPAVELFFKHAKRIELGQRFSAGHVLPLPADKPRYLRHAQQP